MPIEWVTEVPAKRSATGPRGTRVSKYDEIIEEARDNPNAWGKVYGPADKPFPAADTLWTKGKLLTRNRTNDAGEWFAYIARPDTGLASWAEFEGTLTVPEKKKAASL